jgi:hypothetical protein
MFKVDLKTKEVKISKDKMPTVDELMPNLGFKIILKKKIPVKTF